MKEDILFNKKIKKQNKVILGNFQILFYAYYLNCNINKTCKVANFIEIFKIKQAKFIISFSFLVFGQVFWFVF